MNLLEDHPGVVYFLLGMILVVMVGTGLSMTYDGRDKIFQNEVSVEQESASLAIEVEQLRLIHQECAKRLVAAEIRNDFSDKAQVLPANSPPLDPQVEKNLAELRETLRAEVSHVEQDFKSYRAAIRSRLFQKASGEKIDKLMTLAGREYLAVTISRVTDHGLEIRHESGTARLAAADLASSWQERFQWEPQ